MNTHFITAIFTLFIFFTKINAQQDAQYTQYVYNTIAINPAYAGSRETLNVTALYRAQWVGLDGGPTTQTLNINAPAGNRIGLGLSIVNDEIGNGTIQETFIDGVFSYTIPLSAERRLSFGLKASANLLNLDFSKLIGFTEEQSLNSITNIDNKVSPNFGGGIYYYSEKFYLGLSVPNFLQTEHFDNSSSSSSFLGQEERTYYVISGYVFDLNASLKFKPAILVKGTTGSPLQTDISTSFLFNDKLSLGAAYRWGAAFSGLVVFQLSNQIQLGLAYDREITALGDTSFNDGSFEVLLRYEIFNSNNILNPRFF